MKIVLTNGAVAICGVIIFYIDASTAKVGNFLGVEQLLSVYQRKEI